MILYLKIVYVQFMSFKSNPKLPLQILNFASFLQYQRFIMPISFLFYLYNGLSFSDFILFQSIFNITCLIAKIPMGYLGDLFSKKAIIIVSYLLFTLRVILWIFFKGYWVVLTGEILYGLFKALYRGNVDSYVYDWLKLNNVKDKMLSRYGKLSFYTSLGSAVSCLAGAYMYKYMDFIHMLHIELFLQIIALLFLFMLPNIKNTSRIIRIDTFAKYTKALYVNIISVIKNKKINYLILYSAVLTGFTGIFVWNFQPILKSCSAPVVVFGILSFINQALRGIGGLFAEKICKTLNNTLIYIEYFVLLFSFILLLYAHSQKNYIIVLSALLVICVSILIFYVFNTYTISKVHANTQDYKRSTTSSTNTFFGDFASFLFLYLFKHLYDTLGFNISVCIFMMFSAIFLFPKLYQIHNKVS